MSHAAANPQSANAASSPAATTPMWRYVAIAGGALLLVGVYFLVVRGRPDTLHDTYGRRRGLNAAESVNGTSVLAGMFTQAGHKVRTITRLSPKARDYQTIVWFPDDFKPPTAQQREWFENWLASGSGRTLIYVGRDYDAATKYWYDIEPTAPADQADELKRRAATAKSEFDKQRAAMPEKEMAKWFTVRRGSGQRKVQSLSGPWADGLDPKKVDIPVTGTLKPPQAADIAAGASSDMIKQSETLLSGDGDPLVWRIPGEAVNGYGDGQIIIVNNGSFVLNYPLVNRENRKLAARLIAEAGPGDVAFLESGEGGPLVLDKEPAASVPTGLDLIKIWPLNVILFHLTLLGIVYCFARWPIFGRPKSLPSESLADFGKHIAALGELLQKTKDSAYAQARLQQYRTQGKRDSGKSHR